ncbi:MAG: serine hydrolase domain-containing protein [Bryobacteraceae bacterium]
MNRRAFLGTTLSAPAFAANAWKSAPPKDFLADLPAWMSVAPVPGVWVTWIERGKVAWEQGFGVKNAETKTPVDNKTIFEAASLTKQVTAYVAHSLHKEGKLDFDKPLNDYVSGLTDAKAKTVTARHVLSHSSGFPNWRFEKGSALVPAFDPGTKYSYSGEGYVYLARVMEKVADAAYGELVQKRVFDPLGMTNSSVARLPEREGQMATGHDRRGQVQDITRKKRLWDALNELGKPVTSLRYEDLEALQEKLKQPTLPNWMGINAAASLCTTGPDYARFVLSAMKNLEYRKQQVKIGESLGWGLGWAIERVAGREYLWQWGDNGGYKNIVMIDPVAETGAFVFTNGDSGARVYDRVVTHATGIEHPAFLFI